MKTTHVFLQVSSSTFFLMVKICIMIWEERFVSVELSSQMALNYCFT